MTLKVAVAGASGYVGGELLRLIAGHPQLVVETVTAGENAGQKLSDFHPQLDEYSELVLTETSAEILANHDVVFLALPHGKSAEVALKLPPEILVVDCGADFRLLSASEWGKYYEGEHAGTWPYGMPELTLAAGGKMRTRLRSVKRIAVPGCNVTAVTLAISPALTAGLVEASDLVATLSVGTSGAGRAKAEKFAIEMEGNARPYSVAGTHRHIPEILQNVTFASGVEGSIAFTPVLVPMFRGIIAVVNAKPSKGFSLERLRDAYQDAYGDETFVELLSEDELPEVTAVAGTNKSQVWLGFDERSERVVLISAIDNLVKGTAGAAIQSMNLALGFDEALGLIGDGARL